ncbi:hypothetical protein XELAEV_180147302mg, partial [Xenopus laevis]
MSNTYDVIVIGAGIS